MKVVSYIVLGLLLSLIGVVIGIMVFAPPKAPPVPEPPCEELVWMRDSPQARCVEYWKQRNLEEEKNESVDINS